MLIHRLGRLLLPALCLFAAPLAAADTVRVGLYQNPPKIFSNAHGDPSGLFVDILAAIAEREHWQLDYVPCEWDACLRALQAGEIDLMPDVAYSPARDERFDFHREVVLSNWTLLYAPDRRPFHSILSLGDKRIAVIADSIQYRALQQRAQEFGIAPTFIELGSSRAALEAVAEGKADAALVNRLYGLQHAKGYGLEPTHILVEASHLFFATGQGQHADLLAAIDRHLSAMKADQDSPYYRAIDRWITPLENGRFPLQLMWLAEGLLVILLLLLLHSLLLRRAVRRSNQALAERNRALSESEAMFRNLFETSADAMILSREEELIDANPAMLRMFGYPDSAALKRIQRDDIFPPQQPGGGNSHDLAAQQIQQALDNGYAHFEWVHRRADGSLFPSEVTLVPMQVNGKPLLQATIRDISQRRQDESRLRHLNRALQTLSRTNHVLVHARDEDDLLNAICRTIVETGGYRLAWVGFAQYDDARSVKPVAQFGFEEGYLDTLRISWQDDQYGRGPTGNAIRTGKPSIARDIHNDSRYAPWREQAIQRGYASSIALPLAFNGTVIGALNIYSAEPDAFDEEEIGLLQELASDVAFGIHNQRMRFDHTTIEEERKGHEERLQSALLQTIQAITVMLEKRDPYTAGHQRRSADLAIAIAEELQLDPVRTEGLRFGSMIHDIGNIYVPSEILNRPGKLSQSELNIVRSHPQVGYDIVKDIDFPWPVAEMILRHHERLDGSGYPDGLKGEEIPLEARILAVVDVIEAMLSHRPYRPALGLEATLEELRVNRGVKYDEKVVDAVIRLFRKKGYTLPA
jgi:PAS domain S-box-containing protein